MTHIYTAEHELKIGSSSYNLPTNNSGNLPAIYTDRNIKCFPNKINTAGTIIVLLSSTEPSMLIMFTTFFVSTEFQFYN